MITTEVTVSSPSREANFVARQLTINDSAEAWAFCVIRGKFYCPVKALCGHSRFLSACRLRPKRFALSNESWHLNVVRTRAFVPASKASFARVSRVNGQHCEDRRE
jgi:hypothetical protein